MRRRDAAPHCVTTIDRLIRAEQLRSHLRMNPVRANQKIRFNLLPVCKPGDDLVSNRLARVQSVAQLEPVRRQRVQQGGLKIGAVQSH
jgi:hypothetical protein